MFGSRRARDDDGWYSGGVSWWTQSKKDPRFDMSGGCLSVTGAGSEINEAILAKEKSLGVTAPDDIECGANKS